MSTQRRLLALTCVLIFAILGALFAALFAVARYALLLDKYQSIFFFVWKCISLLSIKTFEIIVVVYPLKRVPLLKPVLFHHWGIVLLVVATALSLVQICLGIWQWLEHKHEFLWGAPAAFHFTVAIQGTASMAIQGTTSKIIDIQGIIDIGTWWRLLSMRMVGFVIGGVSVAAAACGWQCQHLLQCLLCMVVLLEYGL